MAFNPESFKAAFPLFQQVENRNLCYLDNAATCQRPQAVIDAISHFYSHSNANTHRSSHRLARAATHMLEHTREKTAAFFGAANAAQIVFTSGATASLNLLAHSLCHDLTAGDEIILSRTEHHANLVPWQMQAEARGINLRFIDDEQGVLQLPSLNRLINDKTRIISVTAASNILGQYNDVSAIKDAIGKRNIILVVDGSQIVAHTALQLDQMPCDYFVCSSHKFYGPTGVGILYAKEGLLDRLTPWQGGGEMISKVDLLQSSYNAAPQRFEAGTASLAAIAGLSACIDFLNQQDRQAMAAYEKSLLSDLHEALAQLPFIQVLTRTENNVGLAVITPTSDWPVSTADIAHFLDEMDIAVRSGKLCAEPLLDALNKQAVLRISIAAYNQPQDIKRLITALNDFFQGTQNTSQPPLDEVRQDNLSSLDINALLMQKNYQQRSKTLMLWGDYISHKPHIQQDEFLLHGCESQVWLKVIKQGEQRHFLIDSDSRFIKGLAALLLLHVQDKTVIELLQFDANPLFKQLGFDKHLSASRQNGFYALLRAMQEHISH